MVEIYIKLAELETKREVSRCLHLLVILIFICFMFHSSFFISFFFSLDGGGGKACFIVSGTAASFAISQLTTRIFEQDTNKKVNLPREIRSIRDLELVSSIVISFKL